jgi:predicted peptidase
LSVTEERILKTYIVWIAILVDSSTVYAETGFLDRSVTMAGQTFAYQVYVPRDFSGGRVWPVVVSLHGGGRQGSDGIRPTEVGWAAGIRSDRSLYPAIFLFPQASAGRSWVDREMQDLVILQLDRTIAEFHGDPSRIYLTGFSMGGAGAYRMAHRWPERFAAMVTVAGPVEAGVAAPPQNLERDRQSNPYTTSPDPFTTLATGIRNIPILVFHGDADELVPVEQSRRIVAALKKAMANVRYTEFPGLNHGDAATKALKDPATFSWLLAQHR